MDPKCLGTVPVQIRGHVTLNFGSGGEISKKVIFSPEETRKKCNINPTKKSMFIKTLSRNPRSVIILTDSGWWPKSYGNWRILNFWKGLVFYTVGTNNVRYCKQKQRLSPVPKAETALKYGTGIVSRNSAKVRYRKQQHRLSMVPVTSA